MILEKLQHDFIAAIFNADRESALKYIYGDNRLDANQRLGIYRGSVHGILTQALGTTYPVTKALLGDEFFDKMCDRFIDQYPPSTPFFSHYGDKLGHFLNEFEPAKSIPFISDMAAFEWSRHMLWQQTASQSFDFSQIAALNEEQQSKLVFHLNRCVHLIQSDYRIDLIWFAHQDNSDMKLEEIDVSSKSKLLMRKTEESIKIINFDTAELKDYWYFLNAISKNKNITELADEFDEQFPELLNKAIQDGWIESFTCE